MNTQTQVGGQWVPAIPMRAPLDVRLRCAHRWVPHAFEYRRADWSEPRCGFSPVDYDCVHCGAQREAGAWPQDGRDEGLLARIGRRIFR